MTTPTKKRAAHTSEPWKPSGRGIDGGEHGYDEVVSAECDPCGWSGCSGARVVMSEADQRRIVACVNACQGIGTEALEAGVVSGLIEAAGRVTACADEGRDDETGETVCRQCLDALHAAHRALDLEATP